MPKLLFVAALAGFFSFLMSLRVLDFFGVAPNLFLVLGLLVISLPAAKKFNSWLALALALIIFFSFALTIFNFWSYYVPVFLVALIFSYAVKMFLTGNPFSDYLISIFTGTVVFYFLSGVLFGASFFQPIFLMEAMYNIILGSILWAVFRGLRYHK